MSIFTRYNHKCKIYLVRLVNLPILALTNTANMKIKKADGRYTRSHEPKVIVIIATDLFASIQDSEVIEAVKKSKFASLTNNGISLIDGYKLSRQIDINQ